MGIKLLYTILEIQHLLFSHNAEEHFSHLVGIKPLGRYRGAAPIHLVENVPGNRYNMQVTVTDDDSGDVLYESGVLAPNQFIENIALAKDLDAGTYPATATFRALDPTTYDEVGQAAAKVTISVLG